MTDSLQTRAGPPEQTNSRACAAELLTQTLPLGRQNQPLKSLSDTLPPLLDTLAEGDRAFVQALCFGVCRWYTRLDRIASQLLHKPFKKADLDLHALLLIGLHQLFDMRVPDHAAISATVDACRALNKPWATKALNAMLRRATRERDSLLANLGSSQAVQQAHPQWMVDLLASAWPTQLAAILTANNQQAPLTLRINTRQVSRDAYLEQLRQANIRARACPYSRTGLTLDKPGAITALPGYQQGWFAVQDEAAQLAADLLDPQPGDRVLDACAAPGGKTCHLLECQPDLDELVAVDIDAQRCERIQDNLARLQLLVGPAKATVITQDLGDYIHQSPVASFDRILLDAPCSASGVIRRHPDIKWLRKRSDIGALSSHQLALLSAAWRLLKPGGFLLYATCSIFPQENERVVSQFLKQQADAAESLLIADWGQPANVGRQLFPQPGGHDGFYYARLRKLPPTASTVLPATEVPTT